MNVKSSLLALFCSYFFMATFSFAGEEKYYYGYDDKIPLYEVKNKVVISVSSSYLPEIETVLSAHRQIKSIERKNSNLLILETELTPQELRKCDLKTLKGVKSIQPVYKHAESEVYITDEIVVKFYDDIAPEEIERLHREHNVVIKKKTKLYQLLSVPLDADALEIANLYQQSKFTKFSHPNFIIKRTLCQLPPNDPYFSNQFYLHNTGQIMARRMVFETKENISNINHLPEGLYIVKVYLENGEVVTRKVVKQ